MSRTYRPATSYQLTSHVAVILVVLVVFLSVGYFFFIGKPEEQARHMDQVDALVSGRGLWQKRRPAAYRYVVERICNCPAEESHAYTVTVGVGGRSARYPIPVESSTGILLDEPPRPLSIDDVFAIIETALNGSGGIEVRYDMSWGYPKAVIIGPKEQYEIRDFEVLDSR